MNSPQSIALIKSLGGNVFDVRVTVAVVDGEARLESDKTFAETIAAFHAGKVVRMIIDSGAGTVFVLNLAMVQESRLSFVGFNCSEPTSISNARCDYLSDGTLVTW